jgi:sugar-specific transcriptional regulator TrmB
VVKKVKNADLHMALEAMGLTEYEAKAYIGLIQMGTSNAGNLSKLTEIPHSKIYEVLIRLEKKKLIEVQKGRPLFFKAIKPSLAIEGIETELRDSLQHEFSQRKKDLERLYEEKISQLSKAHGVLGELDNFYERNAAIEPSEEFIWTIQGKDNLNGQAKEIIQSASGEVRLMMPLDDFSEVASTIKSVSSRGVKVQLVIHELTVSVQKLKDTTEIFYDRSPLPTNCGMILVDANKGMFISENYRTGFKASSKSVLMVLAQFYQHEVEESSKIFDC